PSARCNRRISAQSSTLITLQSELHEGVRFRPSPWGQYSRAVDIADLAELFTVSRTTVYRILQRHDSSTD
ncbi:MULTISPECIES: hypothetical protein, partial [unclassified Nonomuraea]|uniref:hypothetical protein n=1 Tax=unclassified Nonomuraea TaxID=2593643 RepID=UPI001BB12A70